MVMDFLSIWDKSNSLIYHKCGVTASLQNIKNNNVNNSLILEK